MNLTLLLTYIDGKEKTITAKAADFVAFESHFDISIAKLQENMKLTHLFFLAWNIERRTGEIAKDLEFEKWIDTVEMVQAGDEKK
jgi:hypothetical protein